MDDFWPTVRVDDPGNLVVAELHEANLSVVVEAGGLGVNTH